jgi:hypothetical protein
MGGRVIRKIALGLFALVALAVLAVLGMALGQSSEVFVEREIAIEAGPELVFPWVNDLRRFTQWSPWARLDPQMTTAFEGPDSGVGARYSWQGNRNVGSGRLTVTESLLNEKVGMRLEFFEPFAATNEVSFRLSGEGSSTRLSWAMSGRKDFASKIGSVFFDMEGMIGKDFEKGLASLKALAEG